MSRPYDLSVLSNDLFTMDVGGSRGTCSLPALLTALGSAERLLELPCLRPHQEHAWHAFLVQLAAVVVHRAGDGRVKRSTDEWRSGVLELTGYAGEDAWRVVVEDLSRPAFFQTPVPEASLAGYRHTTAEPDAIDVVLTTRNHDVKQQRMRHPRPEHWIYALVTLQTLEGFMGRGNYGIARMNGGFASRPCVTAAPELGWSARFRRDVAVWLEAREELVESFGYPQSGGTTLLWTLPWDGSKDSQRDPRTCDPFFLEVCRRVRLTERDGKLTAHLAPTAAAFLETGGLKGVTGDVWTPIKEDRGSQSALAVSGSGFSYRLMTDLLFGERYHLPPAFEVRADDGPTPWILARVLARGQGKTEGYHERLVPVPRKARSMLTSPQKRAAIGNLAQYRVEQVREVQRRALRPALCALLQGGGEKLDLRDARAQPWLDRHDRDVDAVFFPDLWVGAELEDRHEANGRWDRRLVQLAWQVLADAVRTVPIPQARRFRATARADHLFRGSAAKHFGGVEVLRGLPPIDEPSSADPARGSQPAEEVSPPDERAPSQL